MKMASYKGFGKVGAYLIVMIVCFASGLILIGLEVDRFERFDRVEWNDVDDTDGGKRRRLPVVIAGAVLVTLGTAMFVCRDFLIRAIFG